MVRRAIRSGKVFFQFQAVVQILVNAIELRHPGRQRIRLRGVQHVAHAQGDGIKVVLDAQQLQRVFPVAIHHLTLKLSQAGELNGDIGSVSQYGAQRDHQSKQQPVRG